MIPLTSTASPASSISLKPSFIPSLKPCHTRYIRFKILRQRRLRGGKCRAEFSADAPVTVAIGACILNSLVFPVAPSPEDVEAESLIDSADTRFAVMGIISFNPYFNWMSWVFAWLDTGNRRYAVYALVYLAPYLRDGMASVNMLHWIDTDDEPQLPLFYICYRTLVCCNICRLGLFTRLVCQICQYLRRRAGCQLLAFFFALLTFSSRHVLKMEISRASSYLTRQQDVFRLLRMGRMTGTMKREKGRHNLSSAPEKFRNQIKDWNDPEKLVQDEEHSSEDEDYDY